MRVLGGGVVHVHVRLLGALANKRGGSQAGANLLLAPVQRRVLVPDDLPPAVPLQEDAITERRLDREDAPFSGHGTSFKQPATAAGARWSQPGSVLLERRPIQGSRRLEAA